MNDKKKFVEELWKDITKEFRKGVTTLIGWSLPVIIVGFLINGVYGATLNNDLKITQLEFDVTDNIPVTQDKQSVIDVIYSDDQEADTFSYTYETDIKGHGKIESAEVFYSFNNSEDMVPVKIDIENTHFRILHVNPSKIRFQITYYKTKEEIVPQNSNTHKRAYLVLKDAKTHTEQIYILLISDEDGSIKCFSESEFLKISPLDQDIQTMDDDRILIAFDKERIFKELSYVRMFYK